MYCMILLSLRAYGELHAEGGHSRHVISRLFRSSAAQLQGYVQAGLMLLATLCITTPLVFGVGALLAWHVHIVRKVLPALLHRTVVSPLAPPSSTALPLSSTA